MVDRPIDERRLGSNLTKLKKDGLKIARHIVDIERVYVWHTYTRVLELRVRNVSAADHGAL